MTKQEMTDLVKKNLNIEDDSMDLAISDVIQDALNYCNLREAPEEMEPYIRNKVKGIMDFEAAQGAGYQREIASIKEGDGTITYVTSGDTSKAGTYGLNDTDKNRLKLFRRLRGYA